MHLIFQKKKPKAEQGGSSTWVAALKKTKYLPAGQF
jgi:hypothetical protein